MLQCAATTLHSTHGSRACLKQCIKQLQLTTSSHRFWLALPGEQCSCCGAVPPGLIVRPPQQATTQHLSITLSSCCLCRRPCNQNCNQNCNQSCNQNCNQNCNAMMSCWLGPEVPVRRQCSDAAAGSGLHPTGDARLAMQRVLNTRAHAVEAASLLPEPGQATAAGSRPGSSSSSPAPFMEGHLLGGPSSFVLGPL
jgi:hypothetical protein